MQRLAILGAGESGTGAALLGVRLGYAVFVSDMMEIKPQYLAILKSKGIEFEQNQHTEARIFEADLVIKSPGIPDGIDLIVNLRAAGKEVIDEIEFAFRNLTKGKVIAITGSNGKTTTTRMIYEILKNGGKDVALGGNIGKSFAALLYEEPEHDWYVLEMSSFQLDCCLKFKPTIALLTNITPDHLDRYKYKLENYVASKFRITQAQDANDIFVFNNENENITNFINAKSDWKPQMVGVGNSAFEQENMLTIGNIVLQKSKINLKGKHNYHNIAMAVTASAKAGVETNAIIEAVEGFEADEHRMEPAGVIKGVEFINDSKATNVDSVFYALDAMTKPVIWIAGGTDKGNDYSPLLDLAKNKVKALICMTTDTQKLYDTFQDLVPVIEDAQSATEAVNLAMRHAKAGDVVLLSPACASFDLFKNYMDRGGQFKKAIFELRIEN
jgi:UDP-N-acetylmuramoylalanine--D-glutamate ligase